MRRRPVRRVHGFDRWHANALLPYSGWQGRAEKNHDYRRAGAERAIASVAAGVSPGRRDAMRLLHFGHDHGWGRAAQTESEPVGAGNHSLHGREHLPLRHLSAHHRGHQTSREHEGRSEPMKRTQLTASELVNPPLTPSRRGTNQRRAANDYTRVDGLGLDLSSH